MADNFHNKSFDEATQLKLEIFGECFREWLPVFINNPNVTKIYIYDFFAGSGTDSIMRIFLSDSLKKFLK